MKKILPHLLIFAIVAAVHLGGLLAPIDRALLDLRFSMLERDATGGIVVVEIDTRSLRTLDVWPWPRRYHAALLDNLHAAGAARIALDVDFSALSAPEDDRLLAEALARGPAPMILPAFKQRERGADGEAAIAYTAPNPLFAEHARIGTVNVGVDADGRVRRYVTADSWRGGTVASMAALLATDEALPFEAFIVDFGIRDRTIPRLSFVDVLQGRFDPALVAGRAVIVGATAVELGDQFSAPLKEVISGPVYQALAYESLVQDRAISVVADPPVLAVALLIAMLIGPLLGRRSWRAGLAIAGAVVAGAVVAPVARQARLPISMGTTTWIAVPLLSYAYSLWRQLDDQALSIVRHRLEVMHRRAMMRSVVDDSFNGIVIADRDGLVRLMNPSAEKILGCKAEAASGMAIHHFLPGHPAIDELYARDRDPRAVGANVAGPLQIPVGGGDGRVIELIVSSSRLTTSQRLPVGRAFARTVYIYTFQDITARKRAEDARIEAKEQAEAANRSKTEFLANMSHELRTPLNAVIGFSEIMKTEALGPIGTPQYKEYLEDIHASGRHLLAIINDILDMSKIEAGELQTMEETFDLGHVVRTSLRLVSERAERGGVAIAAEIPDCLPALHADERMVRQILLNILGNAIKFTPAGGQATVTARHAADGALELGVRDTGIGIAPEDMETVLRPFGQADSRLQREYEGTGLGLPLVNSMMALHGGTLDIDSTPGEGTTVTVRFPATRAVATEKVA